MSVVKTAMLLLLLAIGATQIHGGCDDVKMVAKKDLDQICGHWALVWAVADHPQGNDLLPSVSSSHVELHVHPDNHTITFDEKNLLKDKSCINYFINMSVSDSDNHTMHMTSGTVEKNGIVSPYNESGEVDFYQTFKNALMALYRTSAGRYLLNYSRWGHHHDSDEMKANRHHHEKHAECLGFPHDKPFIYDGAADFCQKDALHGDVHPTHGDVHTTAGDVHPTAGDVHPTAGDVHPTAGDVHPTHGDVHPTQGDVHPTAGDVHPTHADVAPTQGHVDSTQGDVVEATVIPTQVSDH